MILVVDANAIVGDGSLRSERWQQLSEAVSQKHGRVVVPRIALAEAKDKRIVDRAGIASGLKRASQRASGPARRLVDQAIELTHQEATAYPDWLDQQLARLKFEICETPSPSHDELAERALQRRRPFDDSGSGYRDTLHWYVVLDLIAKHPHEDFVLLSTDKTAYASSKTTPDELHPQLRAEAEALLTTGTIELIANLANVEPPGRYRAEVVAPELQPLLSDAVVAKLLKPETGLDAPTGSLGYATADWLEFTKVSDITFDRFTVNELNSDRSLEISFALEADVDITSIEYGTDEDGNEIRDFGGDVKRLRISGIALPSGDRTRIESISELRIELDRVSEWTTLLSTYRDVMLAIQEQVRDAWNPEVMRSIQEILTRVQKSGALDVMREHRERSAPPRPGGPPELGSAAHALE